MDGNRLEWKKAHPHIILSNPTFKVGFPMVEQDDADLAPVVLVHDTRARVDKVLDGEARPRRDARVRAGRGGQGQAGGHDGPAAGGDGDVLAAVGCGGTWEDVP